MLATLHAFDVEHPRKLGDGTTVSFGEWQVLRAAQQPARKLLRAPESPVPADAGDDFSEEHERTERHELREPPAESASASADLERPAALLSDNFKVGAAKRLGRLGQIFGFCGFLIGVGSKT